MKDPLRVASTVLFALVLAFATAPNASAAATGQTQLPGNRIPQFVDPLPVLNLDLASPSGIKTVVAGSNEIVLNMLEFQANIMPSTFVSATGTYTGTWTFGYRVGPTTAPAGSVETNVGPVIVATRGVPTQIRYVNNLTANHIYWRYWVDQSLHWANPGSVPMMVDDMGNADMYQGPVPAVPHLHGGEVPAIIDGGPEAWFLSDEPIPPPPGGWTAHGAAYYAGTDVVGGGANPAAANEAIYRYPNTQEAAPLWFHDHLLGATRLNATFAGLAGAYPLIDPALSLPAGINAVGLNNGTLDLTSILGPSGANTELVVPLVIQDRMFDTNGQLFFPNEGVNPEHPIWVPEFVGDTIIVNGKVWPYLTVDQKRYRFYLINGSNSRPYNMFLQNQTTGTRGPAMWVISTDGGYLDAPVMVHPLATGTQLKAGALKSLMMMPGERYEIIIDFAGLTPGTRLILRNTAATVDGLPNAATDGRILQFRVSGYAPVDNSYYPASGIPLRPPMVRLADPSTGQLASGVTTDRTRQLTLNEVPGEGGPLEALVNNSKWNGLQAGTTTPIPGSTLNLGLWLTELPVEGEIEVWEIVNMTADSHPIHLHGVQFQVLNRETYNLAGYMAAYDASFPSGMFMPGYGPPLDYFTGNPRALGGNPDVTPFLSGMPLPPLRYEAGWKDTSIMHPGEVTRIAVRIAPQDTRVGKTGSFAFNPNALDGAYVWHCHITDHEDNEMMRPDKFVPNIRDNRRSYKQGRDY